MVANDAQPNSRSRLDETYLLNIGVSVMLMSGYALSLSFADAYQEFLIRNFEFLIRFGFAAGIILLLMGTTLRPHSVENSIRVFVRKYAVAGFSLLNIGVFGIILNTLLGFHVYFEPPYGDIWMFITASAFAGFAGWLCLLIGQERSNSSSFPTKSFWVLTVGVIISLIVAAIQVLLKFTGPLRSPFVLQLHLPPETLGFLNMLEGFCALLSPLGMMCLVFGWAAIGSVGPKRRALLLTGIAVVFMVLVLVFVSIFPPLPGYMI